MSLDDLRLRETVDLRERATEIREELVPDLDARIDAAERQADDEDAPAPDPTPDELRGLRDRLDGQATACERTVDALGDGAFTLQELMTAETALLQDDVADHSFDIDFERQQVSGTPKDGYHKVRTLELSVVDAPAEVPTETDLDVGRAVYQVGLLPDLVTDYLYECATALNESRELDEVGNLSSYGVPNAGD